MRLSQRFLNFHHLKVALNGCVLAVLGLFPIFALAQPASEPVSVPIVRPGPPTGWSTELGAAVLVNPRFQGSNSYRALALHLGLAL